MIPRSRAINKYFANNPKAEKRLSQIIHWNEKKTLKQNYTDLKIHAGDAWTLAKTYGLSYKPREKYYYAKKEVK